MRAFATPSEALLWAELRWGRLGVQFVRQVPVRRPHPLEAELVLREVLAAVAQVRAEIEDR